MPKLKRVQFKDLEIGDRFVWDGYVVEKTEAGFRPRYGNVNCRFVNYRAYNGDTGHRYRHPDNWITIAQDEEGVNDG